MPEKSGVRVREHVNPLSRKYAQPIVAPDWTQIYQHPNRSLHLDIGCGRGHFLLSMAELKPDWNFLGLEIREPLVHQANAWAEQRNLKNLYYLFCNANSSLAAIVQTLPVGVLCYVTIQFPDPWFKRRHWKRRVVQPDLVRQLAQALQPGGVVFLQSDIQAVAVEMWQRFQENPAFVSPSAVWLDHNPLPVPTERELATLQRQQPVFRALLRVVAPQLNPAMDIAVGI